MGVKPGYKQTEAGVIPENWEVESKLGWLLLSHNTLCYVPPHLRKTCRWR